MQIIQTPNITYCQNRLLSDRTGTKLLSYETKKIVKKENNTTDHNLKYNSQESYKSNIPVKLKRKISILK